MSQHSPLARTLKALLDDTNMFKRDDWAVFLGVTPGALSQWVSDRTIPRPSTLRMLVGLLRERAGVSPKPLQDFTELLSKPSSVVSPKHANKIGRTLQDYLIRPAADGLLSRFLATLHSLPPQQQEDFVQRAAKALPSLVDPDEAEYFNLLEAYPPGKTIDESDLMLIVTRHIWRRVDVISEDPYELAESSPPTSRLPILNLYQASVKYLVERCGASLRYIVNEKKKEFGTKLRNSIQQIGLGEGAIAQIRIPADNFDDLLRLVADKTSKGDVVTPSVVVIFNSDRQSSFGYTWIKRNNHGRVIDGSILQELVKLIASAGEGKVTHIHPLANKTGT